MIVLKEGTRHVVPDDDEPHSLDGGDPRLNHDTSVWCTVESALECFLALG